MSIDNHEKESATHKLYLSAVLNSNYEFRTPVSGVIGSVKLLLDTELSDEQRKIAETIDQSGSELLALINNIYDLSLITANKLNLQAESIDTQTIIAEISETLQKVAQENGVELSFDLITDRSIFISGDSLRLKQIIIGLSRFVLAHSYSNQVMLSTSFLQSQKMACVTIGKAKIHWKAENLSPIRDFFADRTNQTQLPKYFGIEMLVIKKLTEIFNGNINVNGDSTDEVEFVIAFPIESIK